MKSGVESESCGDKWYICGIPVKSIIIGSIAIIVIPLFISYASFDNQFSKTTSAERKNLAIGLLSDIEYVNQTLAFQLSQIDDPNSPDYHKNPVMVTMNLYPTWGLYYSNRQDIVKFNQPLSSDLYNFYFQILTAEEQRIIFNNYDTIFPINPSGNLTIQYENRNKVRSSMWTGQYNRMRDCYYVQIPKLKAELQKIQNE
jgi:hypothetical protein